MNLSVPHLSEEQRREARLAASEARRRRAEVKESVKAGDLTLSAALALAAEDDVLAHTKVKDLLRAVPRVGEVRADAVMERLQIAPNRRVRGLGRRQLAALAEEFS